MKNIILTIIISFNILPVDISAQLSNSAINDLAEMHVEKWSNYLSLSNSRKGMLKEIWKKHEEKKGSIIRATTNLKTKLEAENNRFWKELGTILTPNDLKLYKLIEGFQLNDDREYLNTLVQAISTDSLFAQSFTDLQYSEILPFRMSIRMDLEEEISASDKRLLKSIRAEVFDIYDNCLVTCIESEHADTDLYEDLDELIIVTLNKDLNDKTSDLAQLINLTRKYEDDIHEVFIEHSDKLNYLDEKVKKIKEKLIQSAHNKSLTDLKKRHGLSTLRHLEADAIFLLLDPFDMDLSRKFLNLGVHNQF